MCPSRGGGEGLVWRLFTMHILLHWCYMLNMLMCVVKISIMLLIVVVIKGEWHHNVYVAWQHQTTYANLWYLLANIIVKVIHSSGLLNFKLLREGGKLNLIIGSQPKFNFWGRGFNQNLIIWEGGVSRPKFGCGGMKGNLIMGGGVTGSILI